MPGGGDAAAADDAVVAGGVDAVELDGGGGGGDDAVPSADTSYSARKCPSWARRYSRAPMYLLT